MYSFLGLKVWPSPVFRPFWPFFAGMAITYYGVFKLQAAMLEAGEWKNHPRSPTYDPKRTKH